MMDSHSKRSHKASNTGASVRRQKRGRKTPNYRLRRIVVAAALLTILALIIWGISVLILSFTADDSHEQSSSQSDQAQSQPTIVAGVELAPGEKLTGDGIVDTQGAIRIPQCRPEDILVTADAQSVNVGAGLVLPIVVENRGTHACEMAAGTFSLHAKSGNESYFNSHACDAYDSEDTPLLLTPQKSWRGQLLWDGRIYNECTPVDSDEDGQSDIAPAGTYTVDISMESQKVTTAIVTIQ